MEKRGKGPNTYVKTLKWGAEKKDLPLNNNNTLIYEGSLSKYM